MTNIKTVGSSTNIDVALLRPNNTTQYAAGDVIEATGAAQFVFPVARVEGGSGVIVDALLTDSANQALKGQFELWLFDTVVAAHEADNAAFTPTDADLLTLVGVLEFLIPFEGDATVGAGGNVAFPTTRTFLPLAFKCVALSINLHGTLVVRNAYTPTAFEVFQVRMNVLQD